MTLKEMADIVLGEPGPRDWPEDRELENGSYTCKCYFCDNWFTGYKRRVLCKVCDTALLIGRCT
jgi:hypothetical protein